MLNKQALDKGFIDQCNRRGITDMNQINGLFKIAQDGVARQQMSKSATTENLPVIPTDETNIDYSRSPVTENTRALLAGGLGGAVLGGGIGYGLGGLRGAGIGALGGGAAGLGGASLYNMMPDQVERNAFYQKAALTGIPRDQIDKLWAGLTFGPPPR